ncbi:siderophore-interacting protein [Sessilibacter corallicola]|uniref:siderophore-interacting protein n=1 Tax=Sessilibacter corallicola TaxID=2904075 RepID=UPI001E62AC00|nr:siderophore-interacting protein [Sessilibacter corallicola]MCE2027206.1 siderophore-interacting protein [Sessilibacter corallicola]
MKKTLSLSLVSKQVFSENLDLFILAGDDLNDFPENQESGYVKLLFPAVGEDAIKPEQMQEKTYFSSLRKRTFTIFKFDAEKKQLHLLGVKHSFNSEDQGPANYWIENAQIGDAVFIAGPGDKKIIHQDAQWFFLAGDMTALPALIINLQQLPKNAQGYCVIEVMSEADIVAIEKPENLELVWVINPEPKTPNSLLVDKVKSLNWMDGDVAIWLAGEFEMMRNLRRYFKKEKGVGRGKIYASSYWKINESDEGNKKAKKVDAVENPDEQV